VKVKIKNENTLTCLYKKWIGKKIDVISYENKRFKLSIPSETSRGQNYTFWDEDEVEVLPFEAPSKFRTSQDKPQEKEKT